MFNIICTNDCYATPFGCTAIEKGAVLTVYHVQQEYDVDSIYNDDRIKSNIYFLIYDETIGKFVYVDAKNFAPYHTAVPLMELK